ncbi:MAG: hypothetical protein A2V66_16055 [Ignavibacteria bacterium RBG_13_36_8]|nr:MAG: hypothetical protein A2V66_16055 [Ignavibacteria bacterium RBG_13_36_8]
MKKQIFVICFLLVAGQIIHAQQSDFSKLTGAYLGQKPPGMTPEIFAPGFVSTGLSELNSVFSPDGSEFYFCVRNLYAEAVFCVKNINGEWTKPERLPFADQFGEIDVSLSPNGMRMFFCSKKSVPGDNKPKNDHDIWMSEKTDGMWTSPVHLGNAVNSDREDFYPVSAKNGNLYFNSQREGEGTNNIYVSRYVEGKYIQAEKLGIEINSEYREFDPYIAPDESFIIFSSNRPDGFGGGDLYISYKKEDGTWTTAQNMGEPINSAGPEFCPMLSPGSKYLFFTSGGLTNPPLPKAVWNYEDFFEAHNSPANNSTDIYWVDAKIIIDLKHEIFL